MRIDANAHDKQDGWYFDADYGPVSERRDPTLPVVHLHTQA